MKLPRPSGRLIALFGVAALAATIALVVSAEFTGSGNRTTAQDEGRGVGSVVFLHPDGMSAARFLASRHYWFGPDALSEWDRLPHMAVYRGHMEELVTGTSNGSATVHAFGYRVDGRGSFGKAGDGLADPPTDRFIEGLSGYEGSIMREAANEGHPVGVVNDGSIGEPGTGAFLAEVGNRNAWNEIVRQIIEGRDGDDAPPHVILGGGERNMIPDDRAGVHCSADRNDETDDQRGRTDGKDLIQTARDRGYVVIQTRAEFDELQARLDDEPGYSPKVLGVFACHHTFNDRSEEQLRAEGFVNGNGPDDRRGDLVLYGRPEPRPGDPPDVAERARNGVNPPTAAEMTRMALTILGRVERQTGKPFLLVTEPESTDNFGNAMNAIGALTSALHAEQVIGVTREYIRANPRTLVLTASDSDGSGMQIWPQEKGETVGEVPVNTAEGLPEVQVPGDGIGGRATRAFETAPDQFGQTLGFGVLWTGPDVSGGIVARADGLNADLLRTDFAERFDNIDVYRMIYRTLFGTMLPYPEGKAAPTR